MKQYILLVMLLFSSCEVLEVPRTPLLSPPLGVKVVKAGAGTPADPLSMAVRFEAFNTEAFFSGWRIYISTVRADLERVNPDDPRFALVPTGSAVLLSNFTSPNDTNVTISFAGAMTQPSERFYPQEAEADFVNNTLTSGGLTNVGAAPFVTGTTYFVGVYAYSIGDNVFSLPSILQFSFP
ncbi:MAG: hypothetical protein ACRCY4_07760 [Brevinema sp.]